LAALASPARAEINVVVRTNTASPDGNGKLVLGSAPSLNEAGQIAFASLVTETSSGVNDVGLFRHDSSGLTQITRTGQMLAGRTIAGFFPSSVNIDESGKAAGVATFSSPFGTAHFFGEGGLLTPLCAPGSPSPSGNNTLLGVTTAAVNDAGIAAYIAAYSGANPEVGIYSRDAGGSVTTRLLRNSSAPRGGTVSSVGTRITLNESGQIAATLDIDDSDIDSLARLNAASIQELARQGDVANDGVTTIGQFSATNLFVTPQMPLINDSGQISFTAQYQAGFRVGAFLADDSGVKLIVPGTLPQGAANKMNVIGLSEAGEVAVAAEFSGGADPLSGILIGTVSGQTPVAIEDAATPVPGKFFRGFYHDAAAVNDDGQLVFLADLSDSVDGQLAGRGLYFHDPNNGLQQIARSGDALDNGVIKDIYFAGTIVSTSTQSPDTSRTGLNHAGQVAFMYELMSGELGIGLWSAETEIPGDFNGDGNVDAADLSNWQSGFGTSGHATREQGDADGDLRVDGADFLIWQRQLQPGGALAVPEPAALLSMLGLAMLYRCSRERQPTLHGRSEQRQCSPLSSQAPLEIILAQPELNLLLLLQQPLLHLGRIAVDDAPLG
jgi:hypothetical protein